MSLDLKQFTAAFSDIAEEMGISPERILETIEMAIAAAYKKEYGKKGQMIRAKFDPKTGDVRLFQVKLVVDETMLKPEEEQAAPMEIGASLPPEAGEEPEGTPEDTRVRFNAERHLMVEEAKKIKEDATPGEELEFALEVPAGYGRIAAQTAKQVIIQRLREAQREAIYNEFKDKKGELVSGMIQ
ncbi:hypothetical protein HYW30_00795, partial [Candidatus Azambacteria bacterium]|nr:hypothetical protein [Candidatus Azambacteria bacterium]